MLSDEQIFRLNRWWRSPGWEADDPHLRRLEESPLRLPTPQVDEIELGRPLSTFCVGRGRSASPRI